MKKLILTLLMFSSGYSEPRDLSGKVFTFPLETNTAHVRLTTSKETFTSMTVCFRFFTDLSRNHALFSMATRSSDNAFLVFKSAADGRILHYVQNKEARFDGLGLFSNIWQPFCSTWASDSGLVQLWLNGKPSSRKFTESAPLEGTPIVVLGQEQDSHGSGFAADQSFVGMISNVHMWDYVLSHCEIQQFSSEMSFTPGNVINWRALEYQVSGKVLVEDKHQSCSN
ncbi:serum amyloid P-component-like isoform X1 [Hypomesus transpacificus]|uniref:serum amyloid P-component-like isoform X1 n=1 Tax=Hypomesus transpacificus TaxID=137520 RepID=UPI001F075AC6|nr:serum amyloid P-component-like isoform X1 [Hypomesus transpacificus]